MSDLTYLLFSSFFAPTITAGAVSYYHHPIIVIIISHQGRCLPSAIRNPRGNNKAFNQYWPRNVTKAHTYVDLALQTRLSEWGNWGGDTRPGEDVLAAELGRWGVQWVLGELEM
jgi:hypothetical protein